MTQVLLLSPPSRSVNHYRPPMALLYLAGYLRHRGIKKVKIVDITQDQVVRDKSFFDNLALELNDIEAKIIDQVKTSKPKIIGITCYTPEYFEVLKLARKIKKILPQVKIVVGGIHPTFFPDELLLEPKTPIDFEVIGEGEVTFYELCHRILNNKKNFKNCPGLAYKTKSGIIKTGLRQLENDLDKISYPAYDLIDMAYYSTPSPYAIRGCFLRSVYVLATRGCPSQCTFCVAKQLRTHNGIGCYTRIRSAHNLIKEIKMLKRKYHIDSFYFIDDLFTLSQKNVIDFCLLLKKEKLNLLWGCSSKVSTVSETTLKHMAESGCVQIDFGVERGSDQALELVKKGITLKLIRQAFTLCQKYKIRTFANFLINLPKETESDLKDIITLIKDIKPDIVSINVFTPYPGTEIYQNSGYKFQKQDYPMLVNSTELIDQYPKKLRFCNHSVDLVPWASLHSRKYNRLLPQVLFHLSPRYLFIILRSFQPYQYLVQSGNLIREFVNQKFSS